VFIDISRDFHMHTTYSDGASSVEEMCLAAIDCGMQSIAITDHMPLPFTTRYALARSKLSRYRGEIEAAKATFRDRLTIAMGLEIEYISIYSSWIAEIVAFGWDHLIVSIHHLPSQNGLHLVNGHEDEIVPLIDEFNTDPAGLYERYYTTLQEAIRTNLFNAVGHLDVIKKFNSKFDYIDESSARYRALIIETLDLLAQHRMALEINTGGFNHPPLQQYPSNWIIVEAMRRSIPIIMGSDSHSPQTIGQHFKTIADNFCAENPPQK